MLCDDDMLLFRGYKSPTHMSGNTVPILHNQLERCSVFHNGNTVKTSSSGDSGRWHLFHVLNRRRAWVLNVPIPDELSLSDMRRHSFWRSLWPSHNFQRFMSAT